MRNMFGSKRRLLAPFVGAAVLVSLVGLFMMISDNLISPLAEDAILHTIWDKDIEPSAIMPAGWDGIEPKGDYPGDVDIFTVSGAGSTFFLRSFAATHYNGNLWAKDINDKPRSYRGETLPAADVSNYSNMATDTITITPLLQFPAQFIPTSLHTRQLTHPDPIMLYPEAGSFWVQQSTSEAYEFTATHYYFDDEVLIEAEVLDDTRYLQLPGNISSRTKALSLEITADYESPYEKSKAIETYLLENYEFSRENMAALPSGEEATDWFLFEERQGLSNHFASAYVILARCAGIPARLTSGYWIAPTDEEQTVSAVQTIYLAEVGFEELGWIVYNSMPIKDVNNIAVETITDIWSIQSNPEYDPETPILEGIIIEKDQPFYVIGNVTTVEGITVPSMPVRIWLWQGGDSDKPEFVNGMPNKPASFVALGVVGSDGYNIECDVPIDMTAGNWHIIAQAVGLQPFLLGSDSDPDVIITTESEIVPKMSEDAKVGDVFIISGNLHDAIYPDNPIAGVTVDIEIVNIDSGATLSTLSTTTLPSGDFVLPYVFGVQGNYSVEASFSGNEFHKPVSEIADTKVTIDTLLSIDNLPEKIKLGAPWTIEGTLEDILRRQMGGRTVRIYYNRTGATTIPLLIGQVVTLPTGKFTLDRTFDQRGEFTISVVYDGGGIFGYLPDEDPTFGLFNSSRFEQDIRVYGPPTLTLEIDENVDVSLDRNNNGVIDNDEERGNLIKATLIDEFDEPVSGEIIHFYSIRNGNSVNIGNLLTDNQGILEVPIQYLSVGQRTISAAFDGIDPYMPGVESSVDVTVWMPTSITMNALPIEIKQATTLTMEGSLLDDWGDPLAGTTVYIMNGDEVLTQTTTQSDGSYEVDYKFVRSGDYDVFAKFAVDNANFYKEARSEPVADVRVYGPPFIDIILIPRVDIYDQPVTIRIHMYEEFGNDLEGQPVVIHFSDGSPDVPFVTGAGGLFVWEHTFADVGDYTVTASFIGTALYPGTSSSDIIKIIMPTQLTVNVPEEAKVNTQITINGTLHDIDGIPLAGQSLSLFDGVTLISGNVEILGDGSYTYDHTFTDSGDRTVYAVFTENDYYKSNSASDVIRVYGPPTIVLFVSNQPLAYGPCDIGGGDA